MLKVLYRRVRPLAGVLCILPFVYSCAHNYDNPQEYRELPVQGNRELTRTPFFPQDDYQCGPASLATVLAWQGVDVTPQQLQPLVYLPEKQGSLQAEMLVTSGHYGRMAVQIPPSMESLLRQLSAGDPVVVLQNLGRSWLPVWHYAVAIGYDLETQSIILRSGRDRRRTWGFKAFLQTWQRSGYWAMVVVRPGTVPVAVEEAHYLRAANVLERRGHHEAALAAYRAGVAHWPDSYLAWAGVGNVAYALSRYELAETAYREALTRKPDAPLVMNNLAMALVSQGCRGSALAAIECALSRAPEDAALQATRDEIVATPPAGARCVEFVCDGAGQDAR